MRFLSLLVVLFVVVLSLSGSQARMINKIPDSTNNMVLGSERKTASSSHETGGIWEKLTAPRLKNRKDICVWKICSRPLKKTTTAKPEQKPVEIEQTLSDAELSVIWKIMFSRA
jgi:hypothetical protein